MVFLILVFLLSFSAVLTVGSSDAALIDAEVYDPIKEVDTGDGEALRVIVVLDEDVGLLDSDLSDEDFVLAEEIFEEVEEVQEEFLEELAKEVEVFGDDDEEIEGILETVAAVATGSEEGIVAKGGFLVASEELEEELQNAEVVVKRTLSRLLS